MPDPSKYKVSYCEERLDLPGNVTHRLYFYFFLIFFAYALTKKYAIFEVGGKNMQLSGASKFLPKE